MTTPPRFWRVVAVSTVTHPQYGTGREEVVQDTHVNSITTSDTYEETDAAARGWSTTTHRWTYHVVRATDIVFNESESVRDYPQ